MKYKGIYTFSGWLIYVKKMKEPEISKLLEPEGGQRHSELLAEYDEWLKSERKLPMMNEENLRTAAKGLGYTLIEVKRFKRRDRLRFKTPEGLTLTLTLKDHIETMPLVYVYEWLGKKKETTK